MALNQADGEASELSALQLPEMDEPAPVASISDIQPVAGDLEDVRSNDYCRLAVRLPNGKFGAVVPVRMSQDMTMWLVAAVGQKRVPVAPDGTRATRAVACCTPCEKFTGRYAVTFVVWSAEEIERGHLYPVDEVLDEEIEAWGGNKQYWPTTEGVLLAADGMGFSVDAEAWLTAAEDDVATPAKAARSGRHWAGKDSPGSASGKPAGAGRGQAAPKAEPATHVGARMDRLEENVAQKFETLESRLGEVLEALAPGGRGRGGPAENASLPPGAGRGRATKKDGLSDCLRRHCLCGSDDG